MATSMISSSQKESIFMNMSDGVILMNDQHEITYLNPAAEVIFGITKTDEETISCDRLTRNKSNKSFNLPDVQCMKRTKNQTLPCQL